MSGPEPVTLAELLAEARPGPWRRELAVENETDDGDEPAIWLTNDAGDSLLIDAHDAALMLNALLTAEDSLP